MIEDVSILFNVSNFKISIKFNPEAPIDNNPVLL